MLELLEASKVQQSSRCLEIPLVAEWALDPSCITLGLSSSTLAAQACAREAGHWSAVAHATHRESNTGRSGEAPKEAGLRWFEII